MSASDSQRKVIHLDTVRAREPVRAPALLTALSRSDALPPVLSARDRLTRWQWEVLGGLLAAIAIALLVAPGVLASIAIIAFWIVFFLTVVWRLTLTIVGLLKRFVVFHRKRKVIIEDQDLPVYSVLIALRHEENMMDQLAANVSVIDWPADKLEILLLIEADDLGTFDAAMAADFPSGTRCILVPEGTPLTKPRALNYGLAVAKGVYVTVLDAEDRPDPRQFREAYAKFQSGGDDVKCVQAPLVAANGASGWLPAQWALEYAVQFALHVPAMASLRLPVMLGGTSNHFRRADLIAFGGWDAWNVTEDADLGLRIARLGGLTETISAPTIETAPETLSIWLNQRSRWIKGFVQTWLVCMRAPLSLFFELGFLRWLSLQLTLGGAILSAVLYGPMVVMMMLGTIFPQVFDYTPVDLGLFVAGWTGCVVADCFAPGRWTLSRVIAIVTRPFYWPLLTAAAFKAMVGLALRPSYWAKTPHMPSS